MQMLQAFSEIKAMNLQWVFTHYPITTLLQDMNVTNSCVIFMKSIKQLTIQLQIAGQFQADITVTCV